MILCATLDERSRTFELSELCINIIEISLEHKLVENNFLEY